MDHGRVVARAHVLLGEHLWASASLALANAPRKVWATRALAFSFGENGQMHITPERVRIICIDPRGAVLLLRWRDPIGGRVFWEPPGGGIEEGETPHDAARRELKEETGLSPLVSDDFVLVDRDYFWIGRHFVHAEAFFRAVVESDRARLAQPTEEEVATFVEARFVLPEELEHLSDPVEPAGLRSIIEQFTN